MADNLTFNETVPTIAVHLDSRDSSETDAGDCPKSPATSNVSDNRSLVLSSHSVESHSVESHSFESQDSKSLNPFGRVRSYPSRFFY